MSAEFTWKIIAMESFKTLHGKSDVIFRVRWKCEATEIIDNHTYTESFDSTQNIPYVDGSFTEFSELNESQVLEWLFSNLKIPKVSNAKVAIENQLQDRINHKSKPKTDDLPLPWM